MTQRSGALADAVPALPRLVLIVDQFEELFTADVDADVGRVEREAFVAALHAAATVPVGPRKLPSALVVAAARRHHLVKAVFAPLLPAYWAMHWTASWRGLYQLIRAPFLWEKPPHPATAAA